MSKPMLKKEIAAEAGISPRTLRRNRKQWAWIERFRCACSIRVTYNRAGVMEELKRRQIV